MDLSSTSLGNVTTSMVWMSVLNIFFLLFGVLIAWYALKAVRWEVFLKDAKSRPAAVLRILIAILLGYQLAHFLNDYLVASQMLRQF